MAQLFKNNAFSALGASLTNVATSLTVTTGTGDRFPIVTAPDFLLLTLQDASNNIEVVKVTARTTGADAMTITRAQDGTTARAWNLGDVVELRLTASALNPLGVFAGAATAADMLDAMGAGTGDVTGPTSATDKTLPRFSGPTGKLIQSSNVHVDDGGSVCLVFPPSPWAADAPHYQFYYGSVGASTAGYPELLNNAYESVSGTWQYTNSGLGAGRYEQRFGSHVWSVAGGGTAGNVITWTSALTLDNSSNLTATGNITAYSDERLKRNWAGLPIDFIERLAEVKHGTYERIDNGARQVGVSAQSLRELMPEAVLEDDKGTLSVAYGNAALAAVVQLAQRVVELEARLNALEAR